MTHGLTRRGLLRAGGLGLLGLGLPRLLRADAERGSTPATADACILVFLNGGPPQPGFFGSLLGRTRDPLFVLRDPNAANFAMPEMGLNPDVNLDHLDARRRLLDRMAGAGQGLG